MLTMTKPVMFTQTQLERRYGVSRQFVVAEEQRGNYLAHTTSDASGRPMWDEESVIAYESTTEGARWAARRDSVAGSAE